ncbi:MAG: GNAT family protein [Pseudomonadota bacterium]|nr:GNAT family protein [Pseudomonadota bacterium]
MDEYRIVEDRDDLVTDWVCRGLQYDKQWLDRHLTFGFMQGEKIIGGLIFHNYRPAHEIWWTVYSTDKRWCNRRMLESMFGLAFEGLSCRRISLLVSKNNTDSLNFVKKLGFCPEGLLRSYRENGEDCYIFGMLKSECKWIKKHKEKKNE